jgi:very-short-patch-repair endonuclease
MVAKKNCIICGKECTGIKCQVCFLLTLHKNNIGIKRPDMKIIMTGNKYSVGRIPWNKNLKGFIPWNKNLTKETDIRVKNTSDKLKGRIINPENVFKKGDLNVTKIPEVKNKIRIKAQQRLIKNGQLKFGKHEKYILDELEKLYEYKIIRQYPIKGYFLDGYIPELNLAIEVDEPRHNKDNVKQHDIIRQYDIETELNCKFLRIEDRFRW